jgi:hypothetical protein
MKTDYRIIASSVLLCLSGRPCLGDSRGPSETLANLSHNSVPARPPPPTLTTVAAPIPPKAEGIGGTSGCALERLGHGVGRGRRTCRNGDELEGRSALAGRVVVGGACGVLLGVARRCGPDLGLEGCARSAIWGWS